MKYIITFILGAFCGGAALACMCCLIVGKKDTENDWLMPDANHKETQYERR